MPDKTSADWAEMNDPVIAAFRAKGGQTGRKHPVILLTTIGAKSGRPRVTPLNFLEHDGRISVIGSKGGSATDPAWYRNLVANPEVTVEHAGETFVALARTAQEPERTRLFDLQAAQMPFFDGYRRRVKARQIPVVVLERIE
jgi:deazaflavin-dependent oxidoreductase (nitroreductase family)